MIARALDAGVPAAWVTGDEVYGADPELRAELEARGIGYVLGGGLRPPGAAPAGDTYRADALLRRVPARAWQRVSRRQRRQRPPLLRLGVHPPGPRRPCPGGQAGQRWLLVRRNRAPANWPSTAAGRPARCRWPPWSGSPGSRWTIEERFQTAKGLVGLDQHQVRRWRSWHRWTTLAMLAHAFLVVAAAHRTQPATRHRRADRA